MGYTSLDVQTAGVGGSALTFTDADEANGNSFSNDGKTYIEVVNNDATDSATITIKKGGSSSGYGFVASAAFTLPALARNVFGPFPPNVFNVSSGVDAGRVQIDFGGTAPEEIDIAVFK
ncbi:MAG: hypothetical protein IT364_24540 [Candidatus Hydrogenedentes bacterium]|nr:hypothetical protein [Candidatus Hydrogenedentota bacterium]